MNPRLLILLSFFLITSCRSVKRSQQALNEGNYNESMAIAIGKLQKDKTQKSNQEYILILESAFKKITEANKKRIAFFKKEGNPANAAEIYKLYKNLDYIQDRIRPLLPLYIEKTQREAKFSFENYTDELINSKEAYAGFLYDNVVSLMNNGDKYSYREAYARLSELQTLSQGYKNTDQLLEEAHQKGTDYVLVGLRNQTS